jgi:ATP-binding cassette, sub-family E, member 1
MPPKKKAGDKKDSVEEAQSRIAIVNADRCRPKKCHQECKKSCPVVKLGKLCIEVDGKSKIAFISEPLCIGKLLRELVYPNIRIFLAIFLHCTKLLCFSIL